MPDLDAIRSRLAGVERLLADEQPLRGGEGPLLRWYAEDVAALLAALDAQAQQEAGETCSDCPPAGYPTDKTRCDECPRRAQKEADRG